MVEIINYSAEYADDFKRLNLEWLDRYNLTECHDLLVLNDPQTTIIDAGGFIFLAKHANEIVGTAGLMKERGSIYELVKMAVSPEFRGKGISKMLIERCLQQAKTINAKKLILFSNSQLQTAIKLYENYGFRHVEVKDTPFVTADVKMELSL
jgi:putative acetyltransferase